MVDKNVSDSIHAQSQAHDRVRDAWLIFTTCIGAVIGLLRSEMFEIVLIGKASQQTEPESVVALTKGCQRAIFIGDQVQSRAKVQKNAVIADFNMYLIERHYGMRHIPGVAKVVLDTPYRMHPEICDFSAASSTKTNSILQGGTWSCPRPDFHGLKPNFNRGQVKVCEGVYAQLQTPASASQSDPLKQVAKPVDIAIVTLHTRQKDILESTIPGLKVYTIDEYQNRAADIVIFVTVRCIAHLDISCLQDKRLVNIFMTGARAGIILRGDNLTLAGIPQGCHDTESKTMWVRLLKSCVNVQHL